MQNKANLDGAELTLTAVKSKGYVAQYGLCGRENKANFRGPRLLPPPSRGGLGPFLAMARIGGEPVVRNKPNSEVVRSKLTIVQKKGYERKARILRLGKQSQFERSFKFEASSIK